MIGGSDKKKRSMVLVLLSTVPEICTYLNVPNWYYQSTFHTTLILATPSHAFQP